MTPSAPIPLLYFINATTRGGVEEHVLTLLRGLDRRHFQPHLACSPETAALLAGEVPRDVEVFPLRFRSPRHWEGAVRLNRILRERHIGILHSHLFYSSLFASPVAWICRVPVILETPHVREAWRTGRLKSRFFVDRAAGSFVNRYIAVSEANAAYLADSKGIPRRKIAVIRNGCDLSRFSVNRTVPSEDKARLGFAEGDPVLLVAARLAPQKGHRILLQALLAVRTRFPGVRLVCVGDGELRRELEDQTRRLGLGDAVRFAGQQSNIEDWFALSDLTVLPSLYEGLPLVAIESLAAGRAVVATAVDGTPEVVIHGKTGLCVKPGDAGSLAEAICTLLADPELRLRYARAGRAWVFEHFDKERQLQQTQELYLRLWEQHAHRRRTEHGARLATRTGESASRLS